VASTAAACRSPAATSNHLIKPPKQRNGSVRHQPAQKSASNRTGVEGDLDSSQNKEGEKITPRNRESIHPPPPQQKAGTSHSPAGAGATGPPPPSRRADLRAGAAAGARKRRRGGRRIQRRAVGNWEGEKGPAAWCCARSRFPLRGGGVFICLFLGSSCVDSVRVGWAPVTDPRGRRGAARPRRGAGCVPARLRGVETLGGV
jgi:hypothetical protein